MPVKNPLTQQQKDDWITALRSGQYKQGQGKLKDGCNYCCLGVLAKINGNLNEDGCFVPPFCGKEYNWYNGNYLSTFETVYFISSDDQSILSNLNDDGESFEEIANYIQENVEVEP